MKNKIALFAAVLSLLSLTACKKDKENPTIIIAEPINHSEHSIGSELHIEVSFEDDRELKSYHIHIGNEAGDHMPEFDLKFEGDITGKTYDFHEHFVIPTGISSVYYLHFEVTNAEGKSSTDKVMLHFM